MRIRILTKSPPSASPHVRPATDSTVTCCRSMPYSTISSRVDSSTRVGPPASREGQSRNLIDSCVPTKSICCGTTTSVAPPRYAVTITGQPFASQSMRIGGANMDAAYGLCGIIWNSRHSVYGSRKPHPAAKLSKRAVRARIDFRVGTARRASSRPLTGSRARRDGSWRVGSPAPSGIR